MFDVIVIGGGHAGTEAAAAAARCGARTALVTFDTRQIGAMSCNPAMGGVGKGHLIREIDAFDGLMGVCCDAAAIHYRMLNLSKGPAVYGPRIQADRQLYAASVKDELATYASLSVIAGSVHALHQTSGRVDGIVLDDGKIISARAVVLCTGTFLQAKMFRGSIVEEGGRVGERSASVLGEQLRELGLPMGRLKTGTPPRLDGRTIDWSRLTRQASDADNWTMSPMGQRQQPQLFCAVTRTNTVTHDLIRAGLIDSPLTSGAIEGRGPRYCPSVEDKVTRFGDRDGHQVFLEPEGLATRTIYPNGLSTSLAADVQLAMLRSIEGLENVDIVTPGYAVEYDYLDPRALDHHLALPALPGLFCAGQINGTTGYEEAAGQGLIAGINAAKSALGMPPVGFDRTTSYLGVMVDDLVLQGASEPYRMLTSRAEARLALRADNASTRLTPFALSSGACRAPRAEAWARRSVDLTRAARGDPDVPTDVRAEVDADHLYAPYLTRQTAATKAVAMSDAVPIPAAFTWTAVPGLSNEMIERMTAARPRTLGEARRIRGVTPAALAAVLVVARRVNG